MGRVRCGRQENGKPWPKGNDPHYQMIGHGNRIFAKTNESFQFWCNEAGVEPTQRQASKFRRGLGTAFKAKQRGT